MICPACGNENPDKNAFCTFCGASIQPAPQAVEPAESAAVQPEMQPVFAPQFNPEPPQFQIEPQITTETQFQPKVEMPMPGIPMPNQVSQPDTSKKGKKSKLLVPLIILAACLFLVVAAAGVGGFFFYRHYNSYKNLQAQYSKLESDNAKQKSTISDLTNNVSDLEAKNEELKKESESYKSEARKAESYKNDLTFMQNTIKGLKGSNKTYYASKNAIVMEKNSSTSAVVTLNVTGRFTVYYHTDNNIVTCDWGKDWFDNNKSCSINIHSGNQTGKTRISFTNTVTSDTFEMVVYVVD